MVILLSDGQNNAGATNPRGVAGLMAKKGVRVHTIALGPEDTSDVGAGTPGAVDARTLAAVAEMSGGSFFRVRTTADLEAVAAALDRLEPTAGEGLAAELHRPLWLWPAAASAALCLWIGWRRESMSGVTLLRPLWLLALPLLAAAGWWLTRRAGGLGDWERAVGAGAAGGDAGDGPGGAGTRRGPGLDPAARRRR